MKKNVEITHINKDVLIKGKILSTSLNSFSCTFLLVIFIRMRTLQNETILEYNYTS